jgi:hypothetical protein
MSDRTINEQLREEAERQGLVEAGDDTGKETGTVEVTAPPQRQPLTPLLIGVMVALDLAGALVLLTVSIAAGVALFVFSSVVFSLWLILSMRSVRRGVLKEEERKRASL